MTASTESIGICSLDLDAPNQSPVPRSARLVEAASAMALRSAVLSDDGGSAGRRQHPVPTSLSVGTDEVDQAGMRFRSNAFLYLSSDGKPVHFQTDEPNSLPLQEDSKLPSYLGISCAISGYSSYSRFCRSRENSPARITPLKPLSLPQNNGELNCDFSSPQYRSSIETVTYSSTVQSSRDRSSSSDMGRSLRDEYLNSEVNRSPKDSYICNRYFKSPTPEKRFVTSRSIVLNVNGSSHGGQHTTNSHSVSKTNGVPVNGHNNVENAVDRISRLSSQDSSKDDPASSKSLVEQRIESLFGRPAAHVTQPTRMSRSKTRTVIDPNIAKRSPSCPPQAFRSTPQESPPVFRRIAPDFKEQLRNSPAPDTSGLNKPWYGSPKNDTSPSQVLAPPIPTSISKQSQEDSTTTSTEDPASRRQESQTIENETPTRSTGLEPEQAGGHHFLRILENEKTLIGREVEQANALLSEPDLPEETRGKIRSAIGKANLLLNSKLEQFRSLCHKNIDTSSLAEGEFATTVEDLAGFWDLVLLQVEDVHLTFQRIQELKQNQWKEDKTPVPYVPSSTGAMPRRPGSSGGKSRSSRSSPTTPEHKAGKPAATKEAAKAREVQRRLLLEAKRKGRQQQVKQLSPATGDEVVELFIPSPSSTE